MEKVKLDKLKKFFKIFTLFFIYLFFVFFILFNFNLLNNFSSVPFNKNKLNFTQNYVQVFNKNNKPITPNLYETKSVQFEEIPKHVINAFISIEDKNFYQHKGINYKRIIKATLKNIKTHSFAEGASTISQQLIKNTHLTNKKTLKRKIDEILLTKKMENSLTKNEILTAYLNAIYFGANTFGINSAAQRYFSKNVSELSLSESATLAGIVKSPKKYSPINQPDNCLKRRNVVLREMLKDGKISHEEYNNEIKTKLNLNINSNFLGNNNYYNGSIEEACNLLKISEKDLLISNYKIYTYQDENLQKIVEDEITNVNEIANNIAKQKNVDGLSVVIDNKTGGIKAFYGKSEYNLNNVLRQPGSVFKPIISYAPALENNIITPLTPILDEKYSSGTYLPKNYQNKYYGWITAKDALAKSLNIPSIKILESVGIEKAKNFAQNLNINFSNNDNNLSIGLGGLTNGIKILDVANCYQSFANNGKYIKCGFIKEIKDANNNIIYKHSENGKQIMKDSTAFLITDMLKESVENGTCKKLKNNKVEIAAKTGTVGINNTNKENSDLWNISYTPENTLCVWCGSTTTSFLNKSLSGGNLPTIIAKNIYEKQKFINTKFEVPASVKQVKINKLDLENNNKLTLATEQTPERYILKNYFAEDFIPKTYSTIFNKIDGINLKLSKIENRNIYLNFEAKNYLEYQLIRECEDKKEIIFSCKNKTELIEFCDKNLPVNTYYNYYLNVTFSGGAFASNSDTKTTSNNISIYLVA